ncbi:MAG: hypothetical protein CMM48_02040 [Rhodospirillaceae bacterium]|nr:hypothetical protein [Rhodospirillaceae bacterium]|tara:strand:- start:41 stop:1141 length:1101 start_codon:yes stop_codon:yes gene_type:complete
MVLDDYMSESNLLDEIAPPSLEEYYSDAQSEPDLDMDSLHALPLSIVPFKTSGLKRSRMIKNIQLESVVEMFKDDSAGSGQIKINQLHSMFDWSDEEDNNDQAIIQKLSEMNSYDVYTLRMSLRQLGIPVNDNEELKLSDSKNKELGKYMGDFTRPLLNQVYGGTDVQIDNIDQLIDMFKSPDQKRALENLRKLARSLKMELHEIPNFLEDYGDIFLSLAYFKECVDRIVPNVEIFIEDINTFKDNFQLKSDRNLINTCEYMEDTLTRVSMSLSGRFESFDKHSQDMWNDINPNSFHKVKDMIASHHATLGGVLCGLAVKMARWQEKFGDDRGGPVQRSEFLMSEMRQGIEKIEKIEKSAPDFSQV